MSVCLAGNVCFAETIILKSGKKVKGKIIEKTNKYSKMDIADGITITYFSDEIERIEADSPRGEISQGQKDNRLDAAPLNQTVNKAVVPSSSKDSSSQPKGFLGDKEDSAIFSFAQFYFKPPAGWLKRANVRHQTGVSFLYYTKNPDYAVPMIGVTKDTPGAGIHAPIDFARKVREEILRTAPGITIAEPQATTVAGYPASTFDMQNKQKKLRTYWYQFLIDGNIISLQLMASSDSFEKDFTDFKAFAESMRVVKKKK